MASSDFDEVSLQGTTYKIPKADANPPWGEELNDYLLALGAAFATIVGPADIIETSASIANGQVSPTNIVGLSFDPSTVRSAFIDYDIYRTTNSSVAKESGELILLYDAADSIGNKWSFTRESDNDSGIILSITDGGQVQYTSNTISGTAYTGKITFRARGILQS